MDSIILEIFLWSVTVFLIWLFFLFCVLKVIRRHYHFPVPALLTRFIDNPFRRRLVQNPNVLAERMQLEPGMTVVEIGPGKGNYTKVFAEKILPDGRLYAVDIQDAIIQQLKKKIEREGITNIIPKIENAYKFSFADKSIDRVLAIATLPEIPQPVKALRECHRILKPNGLVCLCELFPDADYPRRKTERRWADQAGFKLKQEFGNWFVYQLNFEKKPA
jgi:ubiquinone/menaquinone biosynthesis C-methylase UbiE